MSLSAARYRVTQAGMYLDSNRSDEVEPVLVAAEAFLDDLDPEDRDQEAPLRAQIAAIRARLATVLSPENERKISAARGKIRQARSQIEDRYVSGTDDTLRVAEEYLDGVPDKYRTPLLAEIAEVRAQIPASRVPTPGAATPAGPDFARVSGAPASSPAETEGIPDGEVAARPVGADEAADADEPGRAEEQVRATGPEVMPAEPGAAEGEEPAELEESAEAAEQWARVSEPADTEEPAGTQEPAEAEESAEAGEPAADEESAEVSEPADTEEPAGTQEPAGAEESAELDESSEMDERAKLEELAEFAESGEAGESAGADNPAETKESTKVSEPAGGDESAAAQEPADAEEPAELDELAELEESTETREPDAQRAQASAAVGVTETGEQPAQADDVVGATWSNAQRVGADAATNATGPDGQPTRADETVGATGLDARPAEPDAALGVTETDRRPARADEAGGVTGPDGQPARAGGPADPAEPTLVAASATAPTDAAEPVTATREEEPSAPAGPTDDDLTAMSRARSRISQARTMLESRRTEGVTEVLDDAAGLLAAVPSHLTAQMLADIGAVRDELAGVVLAEDVRRIAEEMDRHLSSAEADVTVRPEETVAQLDRVRRRLADEDVNRVLAAESVSRYRARADYVAAQLAAHVKADALDRVRPLLAELEDRTATDPFAGLDQRAARAADTELRTLRDRVLAALRPVPEGDPDIAVALARLADVDRVIDVASASWGKSELDAQVARGWTAIAADIEGWEGESDGDAAPLAEPRLPRTRLAVQRIRHLLTDPDTVATRVQHADDAELQATYRTAEGVFEAASAKLNWAYNQVLDAAERMETPMRPYELGRPEMLAGAAGVALAGTRYLDSVVDRARALDERWKAEIAAITRDRRDLYDRLAAEAAEAWPGIVAALGAREGFDPADTGTRGGPVLLSGVHNRAGWDFDGRAYDFATRLSGVPLGGTYEPHVRRALEHAWYELKLDVNDRIPWDVVAVVEGPGTIGQRTTVTLRDKDTNLEIGKLEEWPAVACVRLRVVALHAGPVAVGPGGS